MIGLLCIINWEAASTIATIAMAAIAFFTIMQTCSYHDEENQASLLLRVFCHNDKICLEIKNSGKYKAKNIILHTDAKIFDYIPELKYKVHFQSIFDTKFELCGGESKYVYITECELFDTPDEERFLFRNLLKKELKIKGSYNGKRIKESIPLSSALAGNHCLEGLDEACDNLFNSVHDPNSLLKYK